MELNFKLTTEIKINIFGETLFRIEAIKDIPSKNVKKGEKGGFVSSLRVKNGDAQVDAIDAIVVLIIAASYSVTVTRKLIFAGCKIIPRHKVKSMTKQDFVELGGKEEHFVAYKKMVLGAMRLVKSRKS